MIDAAPFLAEAERIVARHRLGTGRYARWLWSPDGDRRDLGANPYGCADAANLLYTLGSFPPRAEWAAWIDVLGATQDPDSGSE